MTSISDFARTVSSETYHHLQLEVSDLSSSETPVLLQSELENSSKSDAITTRYQQINRLFMRAIDIINEGSTGAIKATATGLNGHRLARTWDITSTK